MKESSSNNNNIHDENNVNNNCKKLAKLASQTGNTILKPKLANSLAMFLVGKIESLFNFDSNINIK